MENNLKTNIELDKIELFIEKPYCEIPLNTPKYISHMGLNGSVYENGVYLSISGKLNSTPNSLGEIAKQNINQTFLKIQNLSGILIDKDYFMNEADVCTVHVKKDVIADDLPEHYISEFREVFKRNTDKYDVYKYNDLTYKQGLTLIPKLCGLALSPKSRRKHRFSIYCKGPELRKSENKEYRGQFEHTYLEEIERTLRFELQIRNFDDMRKYFNLPDGTKPTISNILNSNCDSVWNFFNILINQYTKGE